MDSRQRQRRTAALVKMRVLLGVVTGLLRVLGTPGGLGAADPRTPGAGAARRPGAEPRLLALPDQRVEAERKGALRRPCSPGWIAAGRLTHETALRHLSCLQAMGDTRRRLATAQRPWSLCGPGAYGSDQVWGGRGAGLVEGCQARANPTSSERHDEASCPVLVRR